MVGGLECAAVGFRDPAADGEAMPSPSLRVVWKGSKIRKSSLAGEMPLDFLLRERGQAPGESSRRTGFLRIVLLQPCLAGGKVFLEPFEVSASADELVV
jgi:hypothetical protein